MKRTPAGEHFIKHHAQAVDIASRIDLLRGATGLLGRHISRRSKQAAVRSHRQIAGLLLGQAEIHQMRTASHVEHDVRRLDVAMDNAVVMGVAESVG